MQTAPQRFDIFVFVKQVVILIFVVLLTGCRDSNPAKGIDAYFASEIKNRREILDKLSSENDSVKVNTAAIDEEINNCILMSKDIENLPAAVNKANAYFLNMANSYNINYSDFTQINVEMHINQMASILKQNELNLLNQLIFKYDRSSTTPYTAQ